MDTRFYNPRKGITPLMGSFAADCPDWDAPFDPFDFQPTGKDNLTDYQEEELDAWAESPIFEPPYDEVGVERALASPLVQLRFDEDYPDYCRRWYRRDTLKHMLIYLLGLRFRKAIQCLVNYIDDLPQ